MENFVKDEIEKLFNVTLYNKEFCDLDVMYNRKDTNTRTFLTDNLKSRIEENLINLIRYSYGDVKQKVMVRDNEYRKNYKDFLMKHPDINTEGLLDENEEGISIFRDPYADNSIIRDSDVINNVNRREDIFTNKGERLDNGTKLKDTFVLRNMSINYNNTITDRLETDIKFFQSDSFIDENNKISELSFENILCIDETVSIRERRKWYKSIEKESIPNMNIIYKYAPEVMKFIATGIYKTTNFRADVYKFIGLEYLLFVGAYRGYNRNNYYSLANLMMLLNNLIRVNEINNIIDDQKLKYSDFRKRLDRNVIEIRKDKNISLEGFMVQRNDLNKRILSEFNDVLNKLNKNLDINENIKIGFNNTLDKSIEEVIKDNNSGISSYTIDKVKEKYNNILSSIIDEIKNSIGYINQENIINYFLDEKANEKVEQLDDFEIRIFNKYNSLTNLSNEDKFYIKDLNDENLIRKLIEVIKKYNKKIDIDATNIDFSKLKDSTYDLINSLENDNFMKITMSPSLDNIDYFTKMCIKDINEFDKDYLIKNYKKIFEEIDSKKNDHKNIMSVSLDNFIINFNKFSGFGSNNIVAESIRIINNDLSIEDISLIFLMSINGFKQESEELEFASTNNMISLFRDDVDYKGQTTSLNVIKSIFIDGNSESISNMLLLLFGNINFNQPYNDFYLEKLNISSKYFLNSEFAYKDNEGKIKSGSFNNFIKDNEDDLNYEVLKKFRKYRTKYLARNIFL